jgi:protocatechuate 3,4-dioxygenase beta subunit
MMTDDKGKFSFQADEGIYTVDVEANGYVRQPYGQRFTGGPGVPLTLTAGQTTKDINVSLMPAANVSGRIRDTADQPLANVSVQLLRYSYDSAGQRTYQSVGTALTNDRGEYRMFWVTPGRYYLLAGRPTTGGNPFAETLLATRGGIGAAGNRVPAVMGYAFYPGVLEIANAQPIELQPAADLQAIDLTLTTKPKTYSIRGRLVDSKTGQPPKSATVGVTTQTPGINRNNSIDSLETPNQNYNASTGTFEVRDLMPGVYTVTVVVRDFQAVLAGRTPQSSGMLTAAINNSDVEGLVIPVAPAGTIAGRLRVEGQLPQGLTIDRLRVALVPTGPDSATRQRFPGAASTNNAQVAADGTFRLDNIVPGDYRIEMTGVIRAVSSMGYFREARFEGADVLNTPLRFSGSTSGSLDIVVAVGGGQVTGTVTDVRSQPVPSTRVVLVPDRARFRPDLYRSVTTDSSGRFALTAVAPGDYKIYAWEAMEEFGWFDPDVLSRFENRGRGVHVTDTSNEAFDVRLIPAEGAR